MFECTKCLYKSSHPFGITSIDGLCSGCITHQEKGTLIQNDREEILKDIFQSTKLIKTSSYDCVIPVVGDAEDYYTVSQVLKHGLNPLIVCVNDYFKNDIGWHNLQNLITHFDVDSFIYNPELNVYKELIRTSLRKHNHVYWPFLSLHTSFPVHVAMERKIPLVVWGQNQSIEQVGKFSHYEMVEMTNWSRHEHDMLGVSVDEMIGNGAQLDRRFLNYYYYPTIEKLSRGKVTGIYLSNFMKWDPLYQNHKSVAQGFIPEQNNYSFDPYERAGSSVYYNIHDILKMKRVGYRKVRDHLVREIRHGRINRDKAVELDIKYSSRRVDIEPFFKWLDVTKSGFDWFVSFRLKGVEHLIGSEETNEIIENKIFSEFIEKTKVAERHYLLFSKELNI